MLLAARKKACGRGGWDGGGAGHIDGIAVVLYTRICIPMQRLTRKT
jgi:hypothetical protein